MELTFFDQVQETPVQTFHRLPTPPVAETPQECSKLQMPGGQPSTPPYDFNDPTWAIKLQLSRLEQSIQDASLLDE